MIFAEKSKNQTRFTQSFTQHYNSSQSSEVSVIEARGLRANVVLDCPRAGVTNLRLFKLFCATREKFFKNKKFMH